MTEYKFYIDRKISVWERDHITVEAESPEEATVLAKTILEDLVIHGEVDLEVFTKTETLYETGQNEGLYELWQSSEAGETLIDVIEIEVTDEKEKPEILEN